MEIELCPHPSLAIRAFESTFPVCLAGVPSGRASLALLSGEAEMPPARDEGLRRAIRDLLRHGGYKPTGRGKPASEYLVRASEEGRLRPINAAVDAGNAVSLRSGIPISVVDLDRAEAPLHVDVAAPGSRYVFNPAGQEIDASGLLCLFDARGPCANAVKDAQRTKTSDSTTRTLSILWGHSAYTDALDLALETYRNLILSMGAVLHMPELTPRP